MYRKKNFESTVEAKSNCALFDNAKAEWAPCKLALDESRPECPFCPDLSRRQVLMVNSTTKKFVSGCFGCVSKLMAEPTKVDAVFTAIETNEPATPELLEYARDHCPGLFNDVTEKFLAGLAKYPTSGRTPSPKQLKWKKSSADRMRNYFVHPLNRRRSNRRLHLG